MSEGLRLDKLKSPEFDPILEMAGNEVKRMPIGKWLLWAAVIFGGIPAVIQWWYPPLVEPYYKAVAYIFLSIAFMFVAAFNFVLHLFS